MITKYSLPFYKSLIDKSFFIAQSVFPQKFTSKTSVEQFLNIYDRSLQIQIPNQLSIDSLNNGMLDPCWSMLSRKGKQWRPILGLIASSVFINDLQNFAKHRSLYELLYIADFFHNSTLIIDDIQDQSLTRRGKKCVHLIYGEALSINAGISLMLIPISKFISKLKNDVQISQVSNTFLSESTSVLIGQNWDIEMNVERIPTIENYIDTALCKTGVCPRMVIKFVKNYIEAFLNKKTGKFFDKVLDMCDDLSLGFQMWDDLMNLRSSTVSKNKSLIGEDITEGKLTPMVIHSLRSQNENKKRLKEILKMHTRNQSLINEAIWILKKNGSIDYTEKLKDKYIQRFENKCRNITCNFDFEKNSYLNLEALNSFIELKNSLIKV